MEETGKNWDQEYDFWHKIISQEVDRLRFNGGYETIEVDLYAVNGQKKIDFIGKTEVGRSVFRAVGKWGWDSERKRVLRIQILKVKPA